MKTVQIQVIVPEWDSLQDKDGLPAFPQPANINEMCIIDRAKLRESLKEAKIERFYVRLMVVLCLVSAIAGLLVGMTRN